MDDLQLGLVGAPRPQADAATSTTNSEVQARVSANTGTLHGWNVHPLKGNREGRHAMAVSGPWRIMFRWDGKDTHELALEQYR